MEHEYLFSPDKSEWLRRKRGIGFEEIIQLIEDGHILSRVANPNQRKYPDGEAFEILVDDYVCMVPFEMIEGKYRLKTIFPDRRSAKKHKIGKYEKN